MDALESDVKQKFGQLIIGPPGSGKTTYCIYQTNSFFNFVSFKNYSLIILAQ